MFRQLRLKMTLINAGVTIMLFIILIAGVYLLLDYNSQKTTNFFLEEISDMVIEEDLPDFPPPHKEKDKETHKEPKPAPGIFPRPRPSFFFVRLDHSANIYQHSSFATIDNSDLQTLVQKITQAPSLRDEINLDDRSFSYLRTQFPDGTSLIVLNDNSGEKAMMRSLVYSLLLVGIFCTTLSFLVSFYLAKYAIRPIQNASNQQKNFISNASHELRTPITIMQANLDIINGAPPGDTLDANRRWLANLQDETTRMTELINALLFLARADGNAVILEKEYFSLNKLLQHGIDSIEPLAAEKNIRLEFSPQQDVTALGDPDRILQLLTIFIDNALQHTDPDGKICISCYETDDFSVFEVADTGQGIDPADIDRIFDRFYQADSSRNRRGAGLGLSMAKWIVGQHKGTVRVESTLGEGTCFIVSLPRQYGTSK